MERRQEAWRRAAAQPRLMRFGKPIAITGGIFQVRAIGARVTVLVENGEVLLVDAGLWGSSGTILQGLESLGLFPEQIAKVVITHAHPDHSGGLGRLVAGREVSVAAHRREADIIAGTARPPSPLQNALIGKVAQPVVSRLMGSPVPVDDRLEDGDIIPFGTEVRVVHLPGHTEGSIALHLPYKGAIIVGDALQYKFARRLSPPAHGVTQCPREAMRSVEKLLGLDFDTICFSHFPPMRKEPREALRRLIQQHAA